MQKIVLRSALLAVERCRGVIRSRASRGHKSSVRKGKAPFRVHENPIKAG
jgi:hypothetical protein